MRLLGKLYKYLAKRTKSKFDAIVQKRIYMSRTNKAPLSLARLVRFAKRKVHCPCQSVPTKPTGLSACRKSTGEPFSVLAQSLSEAMGEGDRVRVTRRRSRCAWGR